MIFEENVAIISAYIADIMALTYIHQSKGWPRFRWSESSLSALVANAHHGQGRLIGRMESLGFALRSEAELQSLTAEVLKSSEIEGEKLDREQVRSSLARRLGMEAAALVRAERDVEGIVEMMLDATRNFDKPLSAKRLFDWHAALFPTGRSGMNQIRVGHWRDDKSGPMRVVSGPVGRERVHYEAPAAPRLNAEMRRFLAWFNGKEAIDPILKAGLAHFWFVTIHPFDDGNGRIARAVADMALARSDHSLQRFYSMSAQIRIERNAYYDILERTQKGGLDVTPWLEWFLECLLHAINGAETILSSVLAKADFWNVHAGEPFNERQRKILNRLFDGFEGKLSSSKWAALGKCSQDTASRDIDDLVKRKILIREPGGGRSTSYALAKLADRDT